MIDEGAEFMIEAEALIKWQPAAIADRRTLEAAITHRLQIAAAIARVREYFAPLKRHAFQLHRDLCARENEVVQPLEALDEQRRRAITDYTAAEDRRRRDAEREAAALEARRISEAALAEAAALETSGEPLLAEAVLVEAIAAPPPVVVMPDALADVAGLKFRTVWKWRYAGDPATVAAVMPREFLTVDEKKLSKYVTAMRASANVPGIEVYAEKLPIR